MIAETPSQDNRSEVTATADQIPHHEHCRAVDNSTIAEGREDATVTGEQTQTAEKPDTTDDVWSSLSWWQRPIHVVKTASIYIVLIFGMVILMFFMSGGNTESKSNRNRRENDPQQLPAPNSSLTSEPPQTSEASSSSDNSAAVSTRSWPSTIRRISSRFSGLTPHFLYALWGLAIVRFGAPPRQDPQICLARATENGFTGNADMYGLGVRSGIYIQWLAVTFAIKFLPSARRYVVSSYLFYQLGMIVALFLLLLPGTCTFTAEVTIILQFLTGGSAIVLVPTVLKRTSYDRKSKYLGVDILTTITSSIVFIFTSWYYIRLYFRGQQDFADTPGIGTYGFWVGPYNSSRIPSFAKLQVLCIVIATFELITILQSQPERFLFSSFLDWNWWTSASLTTGLVALFLQGVMTGILYFTHACQVVLGGGFDSLTDPEEAKVSKMTWVVYSINQGALQVVRSCWWLVRHCIIMFLTVMAIESTIYLNNVSGVSSLNSTGQIIPLAMGVATLLSVLYLWVKKFFDRDTKKGPDEEVAPLISEPAIGFPTESGLWI